MSNTVISREDYEYALKSLKKSYTESIKIIDMLQKCYPVDNSRYYTENLGDDEAIKFRWKRVSGENIFIATDDIDIRDRKEENKTVYYLIKGTYITDTEIFAGRAGRPKLVSRHAIVDRYGGDVRDWFKVKGECRFTDDNLRKYNGELHWAENEHVGAVWRELKEWEEEYSLSREFKDSDSEQLKGHNAIFTEVGVKLHNGVVIDDDKLIRVARACKSFYEDNDIEGFTDYMFEVDNDDPDGEYIYTKTFRELTKGERILLMNTEIADNVTIERMIMRIDDE